MNTSVIYFSKTGHSKKIAEAISTELQIQASNIKTNPKISDVDLLYIVGGIYAGKSDPEMIKYIKKLDSSMVKKVVLITSCASTKLKQYMVREILVKNGIEVMPDEFICKGSFLFMRIGHPNKTDIENAVSSAKKSIEMEYEH